jgi:transcriptional regulator with XRE-family HTH domain
MKPDSISLIDYVKSLEPTEEWRKKNALVFGVFMRQWRLKMGWTQYTANEYGQQFGFSTISYGNLSVIEQGKSGELRYKVYYQLGRLNYSFYCKEYENVRFANNEIQQKILSISPIPILTTGGDPWGPVQFWQLANSFLPPPWDIEKEERLLRIKLTQESFGNVSSEAQAFMRLNDKHFSVNDKVIFCCSSHKITKREQEAINYLKAQTVPYQLKHSPSP